MAEHGIREMTAGDLLQAEPGEIVTFVDDPTEQTKHDPRCPVSRGSSPCRCRVLARADEKQASTRHKCERCHRLTKTRHDAMGREVCTLCLEFDEKREEHANRNDRR